MRVGVTGGPLRQGVQVQAEDAGPGIDDVPLAATPHYSSTGSMGQGLSIVERLSDAFAIRTSPAGTVVTITKWDAA